MARRNTGDEVTSASKGPAGNDGAGLRKARPATEQIGEKRGKGRRKSDAGCKAHLRIEKQNREPCGDPREALEVGRKRRSHEFVRIPTGQRMAGAGQRLARE